MNKDIQKHPVFQYAHDISDLCKPLHTLNITYFCHVQIDNEGNFSGIANNTGFSEHYLKNKCYNADIHMAKNKLLNNYILWDALEKQGSSKKMDEAAWNFGVRHAFTIVEENKLSKNFFHFATNLSSSTINQVYLNNIDLLKHFISYFKDHANKSKQLMEAYDFKFKPDENASSFLLKDFHNEEDIKSIFLNQIKNSNSTAGKFMILHKDTQRSITLSPQQAKCFSLLLQGYASKEIAIRLNLSYRTIEHYIVRLRKILGCKNIKDLIVSYSNQSISFIP